MMANKADTTIDQLIRLISEADANPKMPKALLRALTKSIKIKKVRKMIMPDQNLEKLFSVRRIGYTALVKIHESDDVNTYDAEVIKITAGETKVSEGSSISISKRELQLMGRHSSSAE